MPWPPRRVVIIGPDEVGECAAVQSLVAVVSSRFPGAQLDVLAVEDCVQPLLAIEGITRAITLPIEPQRWALQQRYAFGLGLKKEAYDWAIVLPHSLKSALIPFFAEIPTRTGWRGEMRFFLLNDIRLLVRRLYPQRYQQFAALGCDPDRPMPAAGELPLPASGDCLPGG